MLNRIEQQAASLSRTEKRVASWVLAHPRQANWENLGAVLREGELAVKRYDTAKLKEILLRLVPELANTSIGTQPGSADVVPIHRSR